MRMKFLWYLLQLQGTHLYANLFHSKCDGKPLEDFERAVGQYCVLNKTWFCCEATSSERNQTKNGRKKFRDKSSERGGFTIALVNAMILGPVKPEQEVCAEGVDMECE